MEGETSEPQGFPPHAQKALDDLYAQYGSQQTLEQKIAVMELILGPSNCTGTRDQYLGVMEYDWLERKRLIEIVSC